MDVQTLEVLARLQHLQDPYYFTPRALVDAVEDLIGKVRGKNPYSLPSYSELHSPNSDYIASPAPACCVNVLYDIQEPLIFPNEVRIPLSGFAIDGQLLTVLSYGRINEAPWSAHTTDELLTSLARSEQRDPGGLQRLINVLFPNGPSDLSTALIPTPAVTDMIEGWLYYMEAYLTGHPPNAKVLCQCGASLRSTLYLDRFFLLLICIFAG
jgi:hypothetical protein